MTKRKLPPGLDHGGWIYEGFEYTEAFLENIERLSLPCAESHPAGLRNCTQNGSDETLRLCTYYELDADWGDGTMQCLHCTSLGSTGICQRHIDIEKYQELTDPTKFNQFQGKALEVYENGDFAHICSPAQMETAGDGLIACIVQKLADAEGCYNWEEALRRISKMESQLAEIYHAFHKKIPHA